MKKYVLGIGVVLMVIVLGIILVTRQGRHEDMGTEGRQGGIPGDVAEVNSPEKSGHRTHPGANANVASSSETHQQMLDQKLAGLNMSPAVRVLLGLNVAKGDRDARRDVLTKLTRNLSADDVEAISLFLDFRHEDNAELSSAALAALKNDALVVLLNQKDAPEGLGTKLAEMFKDEKHTTRWRDYSLQYLAQYYEEVMPPDSQEVAEITNTYAIALESRSEKYAGTALMAVERLSRDHADFDRQAIGAAALKIALAQDSCHDSRITALRVCALMNKTDVLPQARILAQTGATVPVRLAAIATVGDLGDESDLEYIESLAASDDRRLQRISKTASESLKKRLQERDSVQGT